MHWVRVGVHFPIVVIRRALEREGATLKTGSAIGDGPGFQLRGRNVGLYMRLDNLDTALQMIPADV